MTGHVHQHKRVNLGEFDSEEDILDAIEQSRRITRLIISAVQKGSKFEVSQILEHYGLAMTSRLHFKVVNIVMEQWFSLMGIEDEEQIWNILRKNKYAMNKLRQIRPSGMMVLSDMLTEWELPIGALQSKIIRRIQDYVDSTKADADNFDNEDNTNTTATATATEDTSTEKPAASSSSANNDSENNNNSNNNNEESNEASAAAVAVDSSGKAPDAADPKTEASAVVAENVEESSKPAAAEDAGAAAAAENET